MLAHAAACFNVRVDTPEYGHLSRHSSNDRLQVMRVVSLCPSLTELVFALGAGDEVVGRTRYCVEPVGEVERVPALGGTKSPKVGEILALEPDLVLLNREENRREDAEELERAGVRRESFLPTSVAETAAMVRRVGALLGRAAAGEELAAAIERRAAELAARAAGRPRASFAYLIWRKPWMTVAAGTYVDDLLRLAGGDNVFAGAAERYPAITAEELAAADPARVFLASEPFPFATRHAAELAAASGLPRSRFELVDGQNLSWHGARTLAGLDTAEALIASPDRVGLPERALGGARSGSDRDL